MPAEIVDGNDVMAVYRAARRAVDRARGGGGPSMIEVKTFRMRGHAAHDNQHYVPKELLEQWRKRDPIDQFERALKNSKIANKGEIEDVKRRAGSNIGNALSWAESQPVPSSETAAGRVYADHGLSGTPVIRKR